MQLLTNCLFLFMSHCCFVYYVCVNHLQKKYMITRLCMTSALHSWVIHNLTDYHRIFYGPLQSPQTTADKWKAWHDGFLFRLWWHPTHVTPLSIMLTNVQTGWTSPPDKLTDPLDSTITPSGFSLYRLERCVEATGKAKGGGMRFFINNKWCTDVKTVSQMLTLTKFWTTVHSPFVNLDTQMLSQWLWEISITATWKPC